MENKARVEDLEDWINCKLRFVEQVIQQSRANSNYGKETQYKGMRDAYQELLGKLSQVPEDEVA